MCYYTVYNQYRESELSERFMARQLLVSSYYKRVLVGSRNWTKPNRIIIVLEQLRIVESRTQDTCHFHHLINMILHTSHIYV